MPAHNRRRRHVARRQANPGRPPACRVLGRRGLVELRVPEKRITKQHKLWVGSHNTRTLLLIFTWMQYSVVIQLRGAREEPERDS